MTTTLRPTGPLQHEADGAQSRTYEVCVNSRPVGTIEIATLPSASGEGAGPRGGTVRSLRIDEADRGRGRGTVAALAAEEVLRGWRCTRVQVSVPPEAVAATRLTTALGYTERGRDLAKPLVTPPPELPGGVTAGPMTESEFRHWWTAGLERRARSRAGHGLPPADARARAEAERAALLPDGLATPGARLEVLRHEGTVVGHLHLGRREIRPGEPEAFVHDIEVTEERRGQGHGRSLMLLAERCALDAGTPLIGVRVRPRETPLLRLCESLGYRTTVVHFAKTLL
ncbi:GNAT family N-acetyltransferase [Streptomyces sp. NPDC055078]